MDDWNGARVIDRPGKGWDESMCTVFSLANLLHPKLNKFHIPERDLSRAAAGSCSPGSTGRQIHGITGPTAATALGEVTRACWEWTILGPVTESAKPRLQFAGSMKIQYTSYSKVWRTKKCFLYPSLFDSGGSCLHMLLHLFCSQGHDFYVGSCHPPHWTMPPYNALSSSLSKA